MAGRTTVLSRAYARLNQILQLAGSEIVNQIDLDQAFATHDLNTIVQSELAARYRWSIPRTAAAPGRVDYTADLTDFSFWASVVREGQRVWDTGLGITLESGINLQDFDIWITGLAVTFIAGNDPAQVVWYQDQGIGTTNAKFPIVAMTQPTVDDMMFAVGIGGTANVARANLPWLQGPTETLIGSISWTAANDQAEMTVLGLVAPRGVLPRVPR